MEIEQELSRFYDPDAEPGERWCVVLRHADDEAREEWYLERRLAYRDRHLGDIVVPRDKRTFTTDLTSVPQLFTWLVPRTGTHLAAALVHDALTPPFSQDDEPDWVVPPNAVTQMQADRVFRDAMADLGTPLIRRWMVWSAVSVPTAWEVSKLRASLGYASLLAIALLGWFATIDLFDQGEWMPWMGNHKWYVELVFGGIGAVVIPLILSVLWPTGLRKAGAITGVALAALLHVTIAVGAVTFVYQFAEYRLGVWAPPKRWLKILLTLAALAAIAGTYWMFRHYESCNNCS
ncbi:MAG: DUF1353 domain-containing protein [Ilumatobacteraceae bacterium]|nr:DUF1353 domain-containing protein [Ilumatobacteraceae bacterium]